MVDEVKRLRAELKTSLLVNRERLEQSKIPVLKARLVDQVAHTLRVERAIRRFRKDGSVKPLAGRAKSPNDSRRSINDPVLPVDSTTKVGVHAHAGVVVVFGDTTRLPGLELRNAADLPTPKQLPRHR